jgi:arsenate reductase
MKVEIWHNPSCSKSRQTLALLKDRGMEPTVVRYLDNPPSRDRLEEVLGLLGLKPSELARKKEAAWKEIGLKGAGEKAVLDALLEHPKLIERPVVITDKGAAIGRPPESVLDVL